MIARLFISSLLVISFSFVPIAANAADPVNPFDNCSTLGADTDSALCNASQGGGKLFGPGSIWNNILNAVTYVVGAISVLMVIIGALRYSLSGGDQGSITSAKNTIIYALVALIVAVMANALVNFVLSTI